MSDFIPDATILVQFALAAVVLAITPGPDMALYVGRAITHSRAAGLACFAGAVTGILVHTMLVALGLSALLVAAPTASGPGSPSREPASVVAGATARRRRPCRPRRPRHAAR